MTDNNALVVTESSHFLAPAATLAQLRERYLIFNQFVKDVLSENKDYMVIPGSEKPSLVKPGAEKLASLFGLSPRFETIDKVMDWTGEQHGGEMFFLFTYKCTLVRGNVIIAECEGSCNSWEQKYRYRQASRKCPNCGKESIIKGKEEYGGGWICFAKKGGCGSKFKANDTAITDQVVGKVKNEDVADQVNTFQKMAQKRAFVGAVLLATNASEFFTQDIEDLPGFSVDIVDGHFTDAPTPPPQDQELMTLEAAMGVTNSEGKPYGEIDSETLAYMATSLEKAIKKNPADDNLKYKRDAIKVILASRNN